MMNCQDIEILIQKAIDNNLSEAGQEVLRTHLAVCPECAQLYQEYVELDQMLKTTLPDVEVPDDLRGRVMASVNELKTVPFKPKAKKKGVFRRVSLVVTAAALFLAEGFSGLFEGANIADDPILPIADLSPDDIDKDEPDTTTPGDTDNNDENNQDNELADPDNTQSAPEDEQNTPADSETTTPSNDNSLSTNNIEPPKTYGGGITLPKVAYGGASHGSYSLYTLASHEEFDAILPRVKDNIVTYYINADGYYLEWQTDINRGSEPSFVGETESLPTASVIAGFKDRSGEYGYNYVTANSADGMMQAINRGGEESGLWLLDLTDANATAALIDSDNGGGKIVSWAPDSNKVLYTASDGSLHIYYPNENVILTLYNGETASVCWAGDSKNIVFSAMNADTGRLCIFSIIVP